MYPLYNLLLLCVLIVSLPWWLLQMVRSGKYRAGLSERLGFTPKRLKNSARAGSVWVHAVSVGEVLAVTHLVRELASRNPETPIFLSTVTQTGQRLARERFGEDHAFFLPVDLGFAVNPYVRLLQPKLLILAETEFWPNLLHLLKRNDTAIAAVNARISDRSLPRYRRFRWFFSRVLAHIDLFLAQTEEDARRLIEIGASPERVQVSGNLKFDVRSAGGNTLVDNLRRNLKAPVLVCGSTGEGEEEILLAAFQECLRSYPETVLILAPRHPERFDKVADLIAAMRLPLVRRSAWNGSGPLSGCVFLLDSVGELASVYALADVAFVGGSLIPTGGHNILEPAQHGVAIMTGPHTFNFREITQIFSRAEALSLLATEDVALENVAPEDVAREMLRLLNDPQARKRMGDKAKELFNRHAGATQRTLAALQPFIEKAAGAER
jgi:3-deoxy-D-manno-octulosonic-acid transferase